jgi:heme-degrading monooxygenase HmoA
MFLTKKNKCKIILTMRFLVHRRRWSLVLLTHGVVQAMALQQTERASVPNPLVLPGIRSVELSFEHDDAGASTLPKRAYVPRFASCLQRRNDIEMYGWHIVHTKQEPTHATLSVFDDRQPPNSAASACAWDATLLLTASSSQHQDTPPSTCFVATNRFHVKSDCRALFEERWAQRQSQLPQQAGFVALSLLRKQVQLALESEWKFNYASCTIWASHDAWMEWRNGDGKYSHVKSSTTKRTPVSEWLHNPAQPIFWDGSGTILDPSRGV